MSYKAKSILAVWAAVIGFSLLSAIPAISQEGQQCTGNPNERIGYGNVITCAIKDPGSSGTFVFNGNAGDRIEIVASSSAFYPCIELVGVKSACGFYYRNWIDVVLTDTRQYTIRAYGYSYNDTGNYTLDMESVIPPSPNARQTAYGKNLADALNPWGDLDTFFFTGDVGDIVDVTATSGAYYPCIALYAPDGKTSWSACGFYYRNEIRTLPLTLAGTYTILVYGYSYNNSGAYNLDVECLSGTCRVDPIPDVSGYVKLRGAPLSHRLVGLQQPGEIGPILTITDQNGYYQYLHVVPGKTFTVYVLGPIFGDLDSEGKVHLDPAK